MTKPHQKPSKLALEAIRLYSGGRFHEAGDVARRALSVKPTDIEALSLLGLVESQIGQLASGIVRLRRVVDLRPRSPEAHFNLGCALQQSRDFDGAERHYREAIRLKPEAATYRNNLGSLLLDRNQLVLARNILEETHQIDPRHESTIINLYTVYRKLGAIADFEKLTRLATVTWPESSLHWVARAEALFFLGQLTEAWSCYDWRFKASHIQHAAQSRAVAGVRSWSGETLSDQSLLIWTEQGPGDEVMYATLIPEIRSRVRRLMIRCSDRMRPLFARSFPDAEVFGEVVPPQVLTAIDVQASVVAFAKTFRPDLQSFRRSSELLIPDRQKVEELRQRYRESSDDLLVGIAWRSSGVLYANEKTVDLGTWGALFAVPGVRFVNLQYGDCSREIGGIKSEFGADVIHDPSINPLHDLDSHAAQIAAMDLVVCSSNTAAHFAGALGVETHCMVPATPGFGLRWYWFEFEGRSAWYSTVHVWRQKTPGQWGDVILAVTLELVRKVHAHSQKVDIATFMINLAAAYRSGNQRDEATLVLNALAELPGQEAVGLFELGRLAKDDGNLVNAQVLFERALIYKPDWPILLNMSGVVLAALGDLTAAESRYRRAIETAPNTFEIYNNLGTALRRLGRGLEAYACYTKANELQPNHPSILLNLATCLTEINKPQEAITCFDQLIKLQPNYAEAHHSRSMALLTCGRFSEGWPELKWRLRVNPETARPDEGVVPFWTGQSLAGKTILVWTEQGLGDEILVSSMMPDAVDAARAVTLACAPRLKPLFKRSFPRAKVESRDEILQRAVRGFDYQLSISELGAAFRPDYARFPVRQRYLAADAVKITKLRERYKTNPERPIVGLSWVSANAEIGSLKSLTLSRIAQALVSDAPSKPVLLSLQYGDHEQEISEASQSIGHAISADPEVDAITDFDTFAAQVAATDLVVTISNTTAHLAGALGIPTVVLLPFGRGRHWYWFRASDVCPWYPSVRYAFQGEDLSWDHALAVVGACMKELQVNVREK